VTTSHGESEGIRGARRTSSKLVTFTSALALLAGAVGVLFSAPAGAAGSTANSISASTAPSAGSVKGSYAPSAKATSGDAVAITLDATSSGCTLSSGEVTFSAAGTCVVAFNDPGNTTYAAAPQVSQSIKVYAANKISVSKAPVAGSTGGSYSPGASATSGDAVVRSLASTSSGCSLASNKITFTGAGTCLVDFNDAGNGAFAAAVQVRHSVKVYAANTIKPSEAPEAGTVNGTYKASATATSGDAVVISLGSGSTGCSLDNKVVTFTGNGVCEVDFNDAGNGAFAAAVQIRQSITVGTGNPLAQAALTLTSTSDTHGHPLALTSSGGSGTGAVTYAVTAVGTAGCYISGDFLHTARAGSCSVTATKSADATYAMVKSLATTVRIAAARPTASRMSSAVWTGRTVTTKIIGSGFYGSPRIISSAGGTRVSVTRDTGRVLTVRVKVASNTAGGVHRFTLIFSGGQRTSLRYRQR
jgi:large repetitive protein